MIIEHISKSSGKKYEVDTIKLTCKCPDYIRRQARVGGMCKHLEDEVDVNKFNDRVNKAVTFIKANNDAVDFVDKHGEEVLDMLKRRGDVFEKHGRLNVL